MTRPQVSVCVCLSLIVVEFLPFPGEGKRNNKSGEESEPLHVFLFSPFLFFFLVYLSQFILSLFLFAFGLHLGGEEEAKRAAAAEHRIAEPTYYPHRVPSEKKHTKTPPLRRARRVYPVFVHRPLANSTNPPVFRIEFAIATVSVSQFVYFRLVRKFRS